MHDRQTNPWIHIGECPVCVNGLCRVRTCTDDQGENHFYAICDECEATWTEPDINTEKTFPEAEQPKCPVCDASLYGPQSHWSYGSELRGTPWSEFAIEIDFPPTTKQPSSDADDAYLASHGEAQPNDLAQGSTEPLRSCPAVDEESGYGQDEPKPGC